MRKIAFVVLLFGGATLTWNCAKDEGNPYESLECFVYYTKDGIKKPVSDNMVSVSLVPDVNHAFLRILTNKEGKIKIPIEKGLYFLKASDTNIETLHYQAPPTDTVNIKKDTTFTFELLPIVE
jgi:hypothetical protein